MINWNVAISDTARHGYSADLRTKDGRSVKVYDDCGPDSHPYIGAIDFGTNWAYCYWDENGKAVGDDADNLVDINHPEEWEVYVYVYADGMGIAASRLKPMGFEVDAIVGPITIKKGEGV